MADNSFQQALGYIRAKAESERGKGGLFERLMKAYFQKDRYYQQRFTKVQTWQEWAIERQGYDGTDIGIDLVAEEADGSGYCAIQCKCYDAGTRIYMNHLESFIAASSKKDFVSRIFVSTAAGFGPNAERLLKNQNPPVHRIFQPDLERSAVNWPDLARMNPEELTQREPYELRPHQQEAMNDVLKGFETHDRGKMIMACGTGKTFNALRIAESEQIAGKGGRVLYIVPSIALLGQSMREWSEQRKLKHRYIGVCSDQKAGYDEAESEIEELEIPVTTDEDKISAELQKTDAAKMTVVFSTYHSLGIIENAQKNGAPEFDLILCDEAHRTTGVERDPEKISHFNLVHDKERIRAKKRLYMTATPRLYTEAAQTRAKEHDIGIYSMDDETTYGPEFHRLSFSKAVNMDLLSDYKVVIFAVSEGAETDEPFLEAEGERGAVSITDATKIVGCWKALHNPEHDKPGQEKRLSRAIVFTRLIKNSKAFRDNFMPVVERAIELEEEQQEKESDPLPSGFECATEHVDGTDDALKRKTLIEWLKRGEDGSRSDNADCRILSNARCLSEGVDVPALDAVIFIEPKQSIIDIVQAVGRVMRKFEGKQDGYIILPVACPADADGASVLDDNERFKPVWDVLQALRAHDERLDAEINQIDLNKQKPKRIIPPATPVSDFIHEGREEYGDDEQGKLFKIFNVPPGAIYAKIVEKCGDRKYWEKWAADVADIFQRTTERIENMLNEGDETLQNQFRKFYLEVKKSINDSIAEENARDMLAQHIVMKPVFEAIFEEYDFANRNPVAKALEQVRKEFIEHGLEDETKKLELFYESVQNRIANLDNSEGRQTVLKELYEKFFQTAFKKDADRLGIVYTPVEIIDFILHSADDILRSEFGRTLSDEGVHILDPFAGAGLFLTRLLQSELISDEDLERKFQKELYANEILLLAYYIAAINIEEAYRGRRGEDAKYEPFKGIVLTDTFNQKPNGKTEPNAPKVAEGVGRLGPKEIWLLKENKERIDKQKKQDLTVIVGNPPWSAGQSNAAENNPNLYYPEMYQRIRDTYAARSTATLKNSLYDSYKMAIRWASDRIHDGGVVAFVTNGSWIEGNADSGVRACLAEDFTSIHVINLRGDLRTTGERLKKEGENIFGTIRTGPAITLLVKNPGAAHEGCRIHYYALDDNLTTEKKRENLEDIRSINGIDGWRDIKPNHFHEWINQRSEAFQTMYPIGTKEARWGRADNAVFKLYSRGLATSRDAYIYNFSRKTCSKNGRLMEESYSAAVADLDHIEKPTKDDVEEATQKHNANIKWEGALKNNLQRKKKTEYSERFVRKAAYRPFVATNSYADFTFVNGKYHQDKLFPEPLFDVSKNDANVSPTRYKNRAICVTGKGSKIPFSALMTDKLTDLSLIDKSQCFPRYEYSLDDSSESLQKLDNVSDTALFRFRDSYGDASISKDDIFYYVYGFLHSPEYRSRFANDLSKELPRIPFAPDFWSFAAAGLELADLHLGYETCDEYPLEVHLNRRDLSDTGGLQASDCRIEKNMKFADKEKKDALIVNSRLTLAGIPSEAHEYVVNGRSPLEWLINRYQVKTDARSDILNDANAWFADDPTGLVSTIQRAVYVGVESARIIDDLPPIE